jgi:hypothetical protein
MGLRRHDRVEERVAVQVMWKDRYGHDRLLRGRSVDVSRDGMRLQLGERLKDGIFVNFQAEALKLHGTASVRWCIRDGAKYMIGLQFSGGLHWKGETTSKDPGTEG